MPLLYKYFSIEVSLEVWVQGRTAESAKTVNLIEADNNHWMQSAANEYHNNGFIHMDVYTHSYKEKVESWRKSTVPWNTELANWYLFELQVQL